MLLRTETPDHLNLKELYVGTLRRMLKTETPRWGKCGASDNCWT